MTLFGLSREGCIGISNATSECHEIAIQGNVLFGITPLSVISIFTFMLMAYVLYRSYLESKEVGK